MVTMIPGQLRDSESAYICSTNMLTAGPLPGYVVSKEYYRYRPPFDRQMRDRRYVRGAAASLPTAAFQERLAKKAARGQPMYCPRTPTECETRATAVSSLASASRRRDILCRNMCRPLPSTAVMTYGIEIALLQRARGRHCFAGLLVGTETDFNASIRTVSRFSYTVSTP